MDQGMTAKLSLAAFVLLLGIPASHAADLDDGPPPYRAPAPAPYGPPPDYSGPGYDQGYPPPVMRERYGGDFERCRIFHRVRIDPYGREVLRRVRVCEEPAAMRAPGWAAAHAPTPYGYGPRYYAPPPRDAGPDFGED